MKKLLLSLLLFLPLRLKSDESNFEAIGGSWGGLHNSDTSISIDNNEAQDLLNVDITPDGFGISKKDGYTQFKTIGTSTWGVRGSYYFKDVSGNKNIIEANNTSVFKSVNSGAFSSFITTDTAGSYYDFADSLGYLYRANSNRDPMCRYDGTTLTYYSTASINPGKFIEFSDKRFIIAGTTNTNRIYFSKESDPTDFTVGNDASSPWWDDVTLPGQDLTAIKWGLGGLFVWTKTATSFGSGTNQFDWAYRDVSQTIGTDQPYTAIEKSGLVYFQGTDNNIYATDGVDIVEVSEKIDLSDLASGEAKSIVLTSQSDWDLGTVGYGLSTTESPGSIVCKSIDEFSDGEYGVNPTWYVDTEDNGEISVESNQLKIYCPVNSFVNNAVCLATTVFTTTISTGSWYVNIKATATATRPSTYYYSTRLYYSTTEYLEVRIGTGTTTNTVLSFIDGSGMILTSSYTILNLYDYTERQLKISRNSSNVWTIALDGTTYLTHDLSSAPIGQFSYIGLYTQTYTSLGTGKSITIYFDSIDFIGNPNLAVWKSANQSIGTSITSWGTIDIGNTLNDGSIDYAIYSDTNTLFTPSDSTTWTSSSTITNGGIPSFSTAAYLGIVSTFTRSVSTQTPTLNDITITWYEGTLAKHWGGEDSNGRLFWSVATSTNSVPNLTYILDLEHSAWLKYGHAMDCPVLVGEVVYFGGPSTGVVYRYPSGNTDDGSAITAYWKSKDFTLGDPFIEKLYKSISLVTKTQTGSNLDITYTVNTSSSSSYNISLTDTDGDLYVNNNHRIIDLPTTGNFLNIKFGNDDSDAPFEVFGLSFEYEPQIWKVMP